MSKDEMRTPIEIAREVWPLEWEETSWGGVWAMLGPLHVTISTELCGPAWMGEPTVVVRGADNQIYHAPRLADALSKARRLTRERLDAARWLCRAPNVKTRRHDTAVLVSQTPGVGDYTIEEPTP